MPQSPSTRLNGPGKDINASALTRNTAAIGGAPGRPRDRFVKLAWAEKELERPGSDLEHVSVKGRRGAAACGRSARTITVTITPARGGEPESSPSPWAAAGAVTVTGDQCGLRLPRHCSNTVMLPVAGLGVRLAGGLPWPILSSELENLNFGIFEPDRHRASVTDAGPHGPSRSQWLRVPT